MKQILAGLLLAWSVSAADLAGVLQNISGYEYGKEASALREFETMVAGLAGKPGSAEAEKQILDAMRSTKSKAARETFCRALALVGTSASVPNLAALLANGESAEIARYALEEIPGQAAADALRKALLAAPTEAKAGLATSLGRRKDKASAKLLRPLLASEDRALANAAAGALARIGGSEPRAALLSAQPTAAISDALLVLAEASGAAGAPIYARLAAAEYSEPVRIAALEGLSRLRAKEARPALTLALEKGFPRLQAVAIRELASIDGKQLEARMSQLPPRGKVQVISALAAAPSGSLSLFEKSLSDEDASVRAAGLLALAKVGSSGHIATIAQRAASATGEEQAAARATLGLIRGKETDAAILNAIAGADPKTKVELIRAVGDRGSVAAPQLLLQTASDENREVRVESIRALRETAGPAQSPALIALLVKTSNENERKEYERTVAAAIRRAKEAPIADVTAAYKATDNANVQASLLAVMSAVGSKEALPLVREAVKSPNADLQRAAINALSSWPNPDPSKDLLHLAQSGAGLAQQVLALRGYVRLVQIPSSRPASETAKMLASGMAAAKRPEEKKLVIAAAQRVIAPESLALVKSAAADASVAAEAKTAATVLERALSYRQN